MPNTKSAERRARNSERKRLRNRSVKTGLKTLERAYETAVKGGKKAEAATAFQKLSSAYDKAAKTGTINASRANRKKSRLAQRVNALKG